VIDGTDLPAKAASENDLCADPNKVHCIVLQPHTLPTFCFWLNLKSH